MNKIDGIPTSPLTWPSGWGRTPSHRRKDSNFVKNVGASKRRRTINEAATEVYDELKRKGVGDQHVVISSNLMLRLDGYPKSGQRNPDDPGVSVWWIEKGVQKVIAIDQYYRVEDNLYAIAKTLEAYRGIERWGGGMMLTRAESALIALPQLKGDRWWDVLGVSANASLAEVDEAYYRRRREKHPDKPGGSTEAFNAVNTAYAEYKQEKGL